ncbi:MAG: tripartite tricarboxylate transporter substrate binding protein, partial [Burkholderiales bacterium]
MNSIKCSFFASVAAVALLAGGMAHAQAYPNKPVRFVVTYPAGGSSDVMARIIGKKLTELWGQQVLVDSRPGAAGARGEDAGGEHRTGGAGRA